MKGTVAIVIVSCTVLGSIDAGFAEDVPKTGKLLCTIESAAGLVYSEDNKKYEPQVIHYPEKHRRFVLTIKPIVRDQMQRDSCRSTFAYWEPILSQKGSFDESDDPNMKNHTGFADTREYIGRRCFASTEATIKYFDWGHPVLMVSYDFPPNEFEGFPGEWLRLYRDALSSLSFLASGGGDYTGDVVIAGKCQSMPPPAAPKCDDSDNDPIMQEYFPRHCQRKR